MVLNGADIGACNRAMFWDECLKLPRGFVSIHLLSFQ